MPVGKVHLLRYRPQRLQVCRHHKLVGVGDERDVDGAVAIPVEVRLRLRPHVPEITPVDAIGRRGGSLRASIR
jgi:hypothetical protein